MAKKKTRRKKVAVTRTVASRTATKRPRLETRDRKTLQELVGMADKVVTAARRRGDPHLDIPARSLSNVKFNRRKRFIEMGKNTNRRLLFNLSQAKSYMQTMLVGSGCKQLIEQGKNTSIRGLYYMLKHTIEGTKENTFEEQSDCDPVIEDVEVFLGSLRRMGSGGYGIPSIVEPNVIQFKKCKAKFVLHVEKGTVWQRFNEDKFWKKHNCILTHGAGQPPRGVRRLLNRLHNELSLPIFCLLDNDPWGYYIYSVIKQGSINLAYESQRMAIPKARYIGLRSKDYERCNLSPSVRIDLNDNDRKRARQIAGYPWFEHKKAWQKEIALMLKNNFKLEVEALISKDISYVTEQYVPDRLANRDWLD